jgi:hypothetical protein
MSHLVFQRIPSANYMCAQDVHMTHIVTNMEIIMNNSLLYIEHSYNKTTSIKYLLFGSPYSIGTID